MKQTPLTLFKQGGMLSPGHVFIIRSSHTAQKVAKARVSSSSSFTFIFLIIDIKARCEWAALVEAAPLKWVKGVSDS